MMKLDENYLRSSPKHGLRMNRIVAVSLLVAADSAVFFISLVTGYFFVNGLSLQGISSLVVSAYARIIVTGWFLYLVSLNLFSAYRPGNIYSIWRSCAGVGAFLFAIVGLSMMYPSLRFSLGLALFSSVSMAVMLTITRLTIRRYR